MTDLTLEFFIYSVLGWLLEGAWQYIVTGKFRDKRMLLHLPMCPVYGLGAVILTHMLSAFSEDFLLLFTFGSLLASAVELLYFLVNEAMYGVMVWDYSNQPANFAGGVCAFYTLMWGILSVALVRYISPAAQLLCAHMSAEFKLICVVFLGIVTASDAVKTQSVFRKFKSGEIENLPPCFWYMRKKS